MPLLQLFQRLRLKVHVSLNGQPHRADRFLQLLERKVSILDIEPRDQAKEDIFAIELAGVPGPVAVRGEELDLRKGVCAPFLAVVQFGQLLARSLVEQVLPGGRRFFGRDFFTNNKQPIVQAFQVLHLGQRAVIISQVGQQLEHLPPRAPLPKNG